MHIYIYIYIYICIFICMMYIIMYIFSKTFLCDANRKHWSSLLPFKIPCIITPLTWPICQTRRKSTIVNVKRWRRSTCREKYPHVCDCCGCTCKHVLCHHLSLRNMGNNVCKLNSKCRYIIPKAYNTTQIRTSLYTSFPHFEFIYCWKYLLQKSIFRAWYALQGRLSQHHEGYYHT